jgi:transposase-like protein
VLLLVLGVREDGQKVLLAVKNMGGETSEAWRAVLFLLVGRAAGNQFEESLNDAHRRGCAGGDRGGSGGAG